MQKLENGYDSLLRLGFRREAVAFMKERADVFMTIARKHNDVTPKHEFMLRALRVLRQAAQVTDAVSHDVQTQLPLGEVWLRAFKKPF